MVQITSLHLGYKKEEDDRPWSIGSQQDPTRCDGPGFLPSMARCCCSCSTRSGGVIMAYENVQLVSSHGWLFDTNPFNHITIRAQFYVFSPEVGSILEGVVKKRTVNHIGCLVHGMFNVSVPRPVDISVDEWCGTVAEEGDPVKLTITHINMKNFLPYIVAKLYPERLKELVNSRTQGNVFNWDSTDASRLNTRIIFDDDSGISITEAQESLDSAEIKETKEQITSSECKMKIDTNERTSKEKIKSKKRKRQYSSESQEESDMMVPEKKKRKKKNVVDEYFDENQGESDMVVTKKKKRKRNNVEEKIDGNADEEFEGSNHKTTKKRKKKHFMDQNTNENIDVEQNTIEEVHISEDIAYPKEDEVQMPIVLRTSEAKSKKSRNGNQKFSKKNDKVIESRNDWNADEEFKDISAKSNRKKEKKHYVDHSSNEVGLKENSDDRLQIPKETEYYKENEAQIPIVSGTSKVKVKKSRNGNKKELPENIEKKESFNSSRVIETHTKGSIKDSLPLLTKSVEGNLASSEQTSVVQSSSKKLKDSNIASQQKEKVLSECQELGASGIITAKINTKSSRKKSKSRNELEDSMFADLHIPDLNFD
ncbi:uncharacterized protein [Panulirus ornatus]|uniref:uncharacterized protein isoform X2 n=1 Tax=Panulirus ornatus TaxID=150431 RepID=UPI003A8884E9